MRPAHLGQFEEPPLKYDPEWMNRMLYQMEQIFVKLGRAIDGGLGFGDGIDIDNLVGKWMTYTSNGVANTDDALTHSLGVVPIGFIVMLPPLSGTINRGSGTWTTSQIFLRCSAASQTAKIFVVIPSQGLQT